MMESRLYHIMYYNHAAVTEQLNCVRRSPWIMKRVDEATAEL